MLFAGIFALKVAKLNSFFLLFTLSEETTAVNFLDVENGDDCKMCYHYAGTSLPGWDFLALLGLLCLAGTSWPGWDFLAF